MEIIFVILSILPVENPVQNLLKKKISEILP